MCVFVAIHVGFTAFEQLSIAGLLICMWVLSVFQVIMYVFVAMHVGFMLFDCLLKAQ